MKVLTIDTSDNKQISIGLKINGNYFVKKKKIGANKAQEALPMIEKIIKEKGLDLKDLDLIEVNTGPGSFTGIRVGISIANALGFSLKIPVNGKVDNIVSPHYF